MAPRDALSDVSFSVKPGQLLMVTGKVGSGKVRQKSVTKPDAINREPYFCDVMLADVAVESADGSASSHFRFGALLCVGCLRASVAWDIFEHAQTKYRVL